MDDAQSEYERWVKPIEERMMRTAWRIVRDRDEAQDAIQQTLETLLKKWPRVRRHPNPPALIMRVCVQTAYNCLRQRLRRARRELSDIHLEHRHCPEPGAAADERLVASETLEAIHAAISTLPPMQQGAVSLRLLADLPFDAIAQALGCSEVTARTNCMHALRKLRSQLAQYRQEARPEPRPETGPEIRKEPPHEA